MTFPREEPKLKIFWVGVVAIQGLYCAIAAALQHNDPDPYLWMGAYGVPALLSIRLLLQGRCCARSWGNLENKVVEVWMGYCCFLGGYTLAQHFGWGLDNGLLLEEGGWGMLGEEGKELMGLCILLIYLQTLHNLNFWRLGVRGGVALGVALTTAPLILWLILHNAMDHTHC